MCVLGGGDAKSRVLFIYLFFSGGGEGVIKLKHLIFSIVILNWRLS